MDEFEQMAADLEFRQTQRLRAFTRKSKKNTFERFWENDNEKRIFETINVFRKHSRTYDPSNPR